MNKKTIGLLAIGLVVLLAASGIAAFYLLASGNGGAYSNAIRVACVGDSLTQSSAYSYYLWEMLGSNAPFTIGNYTEYPNETRSDASSGNASYAVGNFGAGTTMVAIKSETPYMNTSTFQRALEFQPNIVVIMLGTNDAQPGAHQYNASFVDDYKKLIYAFQTLPSNPKIWIVLPPPIFDNQGGKTSPEFLEQVIIPGIRQVANETNLPLIDVHSALASGSQDFPDGIHPNRAASKLIADEVYSAITGQNASNAAPIVLTVAGLVKKS